MNISEQIAAHIARSLVGALLVLPEREAEAARIAARIVAGGTADLREQAMGASIMAVQLAQALEAGQVARDELARATAEIERLRESLGAHQPGGTV